MRNTGFICEEIIFWHDNGAALLSVPAGGLYQAGDHIESPNPKRRLKSLVEVSGLHKHLVPLEGRSATDQDILEFHTPEYLSSLKEASKVVGGTPFGELCYVGNGSFEIAARSCGAVISGIRAILNNEVSNAYIVTRPSGHHAMPDRAMGYCLLGNIPIAIKHAQRELGLKRVAVLDWDVHHGNGTETGFYDRNDVLTMSIHEAENYPFDTGTAEDIGNSEGLGFNLNIPLPPGSGIGAYEYAIEKLIAPKLQEFKPDLIIIASGYDACVFDPMGHMLLPASAYGNMTSTIMKLADTLCDGKLLVVHEGGYSDAYVPLCGVSVIEHLSGRNTDVVDPYGAAVENNPGQHLKDWQKSIVDDVAKLHFSKP